MSFCGYYYLVIIRIIIMKVWYAVEPLIMHSPRSGQPLYDGQVQLHIEISIVVILNQPPEKQLDAS